MCAPRPGRHCRRRRRRRLLAAHSCCCPPSSRSFQQPFDAVIDAQGAASASAAIMKSGLLTLLPARRRAPSPSVMCRRRRGPACKAPGSRTQLPATCRHDCWITATSMQCMLSWEAGQYAASLFDGYRQHPIPAAHFTHRLPPPRMMPAGHEPGHGRHAHRRHPGEPFN